LNIEYLTLNVEYFFFEILNIQRSIFNKKKGLPGNRNASNDCLPYEKNTYFFRESALALIVSVAAFAVESIADFALSTVAVTAESTAATAESTLVSLVSAALLQATNAALTAKTNKSFFMRVSFCLLMNDLVFIL